MAGATMVREPAVAGAFYPGSPEAVAREVRHLLSNAQAPAPRRALAVVSPHAGWRYSGALAGKLFASVEVPERVVVMAPNHTGRGPRASLWPAGAWRLPGFDVPVDADFASRLLARCEETGGAPLEADRDAHDEEHAIEVLLPLLSARQTALHLVPLVLGRLSFAECEALGSAIARTVKESSGPTLIVASSDMNHYLPDDQTRAIDQLALAPLTAMDARGLWDAVRANGITMCGYIPATVALLAADALGAGRAELVGYATSADAGGDRERVVGYAAVAIG